MALQEHTSAGFGFMALARNHQDLEFEIGALASRHGLSVDVARSIVVDCGHDMDCIDAHAKIWKARNLA